MAADDLPSKERVNRAGAKLARWLVDVEIELSDDELNELAIPVLQWREQHAYPMELVMPSLREWAARFSSSHIQPSQRLKRMHQILNKLNRHPGMKLARMQDIGGTRAVFGNRDEVEKVHELIRQSWGVDRTKDWRDNGRPDTGYRALHLMVAKRDRISDEDRIIEIQLRTATEQRWADAIMATGDQLGYALRDGEGPPKLLGYFKLASDVLAATERGEAPDSELRSRFSDAREQVRPYFTMKETD